MGAIFAYQISFHFRHLCELFNIVDRLQAKKPDNISVAIHTWFDGHDAGIPRFGPGAVAFLSCLLPERRSDRVLGVCQRDLEPVIPSAHGLGHTHMKELQR